MSFSLFTFLRLHGFCAVLRQYFDAFLLHTIYCIHTILPRYCWTALIYMPQTLNPRLY